MTFPSWHGWKEAEWDSKGGLQTPKLFLVSLSQAASRVKLPKPPSELPQTPPSLPHHQ